jgi:hypothetical protein
MTCQFDDVAFADWLTFGRVRLRHVAFSSNGKVPRGPMKGCHVAPIDLLLVFKWISKIIWSPRGSTPGPPPTIQCFNIGQLTNAPINVSCYGYIFKII